MAIKVLIDWNFTGGWDDSEPYETDGQYVYDAWPDIMDVEWQLGHSRPFQAIPDLDKATLHLKNITGDYTPNNTAGQFNGKFQFGVPVKIEINGTTMFIGRIHEYRPNWMKAGSTYTGRTDAYIEVIGGINLLSEAEMPLNVLRNLRGDQIIGQVLRKVKFLPPAKLFKSGDIWQLERGGFSELGTTTKLADPSDYSDLDQGVVTFGYYGDVRDEETQSAVKVIQDISEAERGKFWFDRSGKATWLNRYHLIDDLTLMGHIDSDPGGNDKPFMWGRPQFSPFYSNRVTALAYPRSEGEVDATLWELDKPIFLFRGEVRRVIALFRDGGVRVSTENARVSDLNMAEGSASIRVLAKADRAELIITNDSPTLTATINSFKLVGKALDSESRIEYAAADIDEQYENGPKGEMRINLRALDSYAEAKDVAELELGRRKVKTLAIPSVDLVAQTDNVDNQWQIFWTLGHRLRIRDSYLGHDQDYHVIGERQKISEGGKLHQTTLYLEPVIFNRLASLDWRKVDSQLLWDAAAEPAADAFSMVGAVYTASSTESGFPVSNLFDNDPDNYWRSSGNVPQWVQVELPEKVCIRDWQLQAANGASLTATPRDFQLQYLDDDGVFQDAEIQTGVEFFSDGQIYQFQTVNAFFSTTWRLYITAVNGASHVILGDFKGAPLVFTCAQGFKLSSAQSLETARFWLGKSGNPEGEITMTLHTGADTPSIPGFATADTNPDLRDVEGQPGWVEWVFDPPVALAANTQYWALFETRGKIDNNNYLTIGTADAILTLGLESWWSVDETSSPWVDSHGANNLALVGSKTSPVGRRGRASRTANGSYLRALDSASLKTGDIDFTVSAWVKFPTDLSAVTWIVGKWQTSGQREYILVYNNGNNRIQFLVSNNGTASTALSANAFGAIVVGRWYHVVGWHDSVNDRIGISVNNLTNTAAHTTGVFSGTNNVLLGGVGANVIVDEVGFWKRVLTADERAMLYNGGFGMSYRDVNPYEGGPLLQDIGLSGLQERYKRAAFELYGSKF